MSTETKKVAKKKKVSITKAIYVLLESQGPELTSVEQATELAKMVNKDTKFNKWHLYFHRRNYRELDRLNELPKIEEDMRTSIMKLIEGLKSAPKDLGKKDKEAKSDKSVKSVNSTKSNKSGKKKKRKKSAKAS